MIESELLKISKLNNFSNVYEKNFNLNSDKKIVFQGKMSIPSLEIGKIDIKGMYNIYKNSERFINPIFVLENENKYKIKYNIKKSSGRGSPAAPVHNRSVPATSWPHRTGSSAPAYWTHHAALRYWDIYYTPSGLPHCSLPFREPR